MIDAPRSGPASERRRPLAPPAEPPRPFALSERGYAGVVAAAVVALGAFLALRVTAWPPHEDETLPLFLGQESLARMLETVLSERGGAPLHFLFAWLVAQSGGGVHELRLVSATFALACVPLVGELARRLAGRTAAAIAVALVASSWMLLFHAVYGRMYTLFLFTALLSYLGLLAAVDGGGARRWGAWIGATWLTIASHPYGALVLASQLVFVLLLRRRLREAAAAFALLVVAALPFWLTNLVLASRFDVGVGAGGGALDGPLAVVRYFYDALGDFSGGPPVAALAAALAAVGIAVLWRTRRASALLVLAVFGVPAAAFAATRFGPTAMPVTRHLIFVQPFFAVAVAAGLVAIGRSGRAGAARAAALSAALLVVGAAGYAWAKSPQIFVAEPADRVAARAAAAAWLVETGRPDDVLLGYDPVFFEGWREDDSFSRLVLPRADARLAAARLGQAPRPLGRGVWVFNAAATTNLQRRHQIPLRLPRPAEAFEARTFGPYLVLRTREPTGTADTYLRRAAAAMIVGKTLLIGDADINFHTISRAAELVDYEVSTDSSRSTSSR